MTHKIGWLNRPGTTGATWNPVTGCTKCSEGCKNCYAERMSKRLSGRFGYPEDEPFRVTLHEDKLDAPLGWKKPRTVFVCSMGDLFHEDVPFWYIARIVDVMESAPEHTFLLLTKRPDRMLDFTEWMCREGEDLPMSFTRWPDNIWLGTTIEKPEYSYRAEYLRRCPAAVRFLSLEPLLGSMADYPGIYDDMDWIICGGETGHGARPAHPDWIRDIRDRCKLLGIPFFFKQWGAWAPYPHHDNRFGPTPPSAIHWFGEQKGPPDMWRINKKNSGYLLDGKEHHEWPQ